MKKVQLDGKVKGFLRTVLKKGVPYHQSHANEASRILKNIESERGKLSRRIVNECDDYAMEVLGGKYYAPWLYVYAIVAGQFKPGWIPDNFYGAKVVPAIKGHYGNCGDLRSLNSLFFDAKEFPDLGSYINGFFLDKHYSVLPKKDFKELLFAECDCIVFKTDRSRRGKGIHFFDKENFNADDIVMLGNGLFQRYVTQNKVFNDFSYTSVATLRITTAINNNGEASVRGSFLRLGTEGDTHVQSATNIKVPVDLVTGDLRDTGYLPSWLTTPLHPTSQKCFANVKIPNFKKCVDIVSSLHQKVPYVRCIGWDLILDQEGEVVIFEWNGAHNGIKFTEATQGPSFVDLGWERFR